MKVTVTKYTVILRIMSNQPLSIPIILIAQILASDFTTVPIHSPVKDMLISTTIQPQKQTKYLLAGALRRMNGHIWVFYTKFT